MNLFLRQFGLVLISRLISEEVITRLVAALVLFVEARVKQSPNVIDDKVLEGLEKVVTQKDLTDFILIFLKGNIKI